MATTCRLFIFITECVDPMKISVLYPLTGTTADRTDGVGVKGFVAMHCIRYPKKQIVDVRTDNACIDYFDLTKELFTVRLFGAQVKP